jgi:hypothetical protein
LALSSEEHRIRDGEESREKSSAPDEPVSEVNASVCSSSIAFTASLNMDRSRNTI